MKSPARAGIPAIKLLRHPVHIAGVALLFQAFFLSGLSMPGPSFAEEAVPERYTLSSAISFALKHNPGIRRSRKEIESQSYAVQSAKADRLPKVDVGTGVSRYRYPMPLTPIVITPPITPDISLPRFERTIYDAGTYFRLPLYRGGRLERGLLVAEMKEAVARDNYATSRQELIYNLTSVYYKILQLEKVLLSHEASVTQLRAHKSNVELFLKAGTVPRLDLLKTEVELSHAQESRLLVKNNMESVCELLKTLLGLEDQSRQVSVAEEGTVMKPYPALDESVQQALSRRPDYKAVLKRQRIAEEQVKIAGGRRLPDVFAAGQYTGQSGTDFAFKENWNVGVHLTLPVFDGGIISAEIQKERVELAKVREEERALRFAITREVRDAHLTIANVRERIEVTEKAIDSGRETFRVELLKYQTGAGTTTDVIDAQTALLRAETDYHQALYDKEIAVASLTKAIGEEPGEESGE